jgi:hypothetical protein
MKLAVDHILRPNLPWRAEAGITECGYDASKVQTLTRVEYFARLKEYGQQRSAMLTCMTCAQTAQRWDDWQADPRKALEREIAWECGWRGSDRGEQLRDDLVAAASLIAAHREEFEANLAEIAQRRDWNAKKAALVKAKAAPRPPEPRGRL